MDERELIVQEGKGVIAQANAIVITDAASYAKAGEFWGKCTERKNQAEAFMRPRIDEAHKHHKNLVADLKMLVDPFDTGGRIAKGKIIAYDQEERKKRELEEARLMAEQKAKAEADQKALAEELKRAGLDDQAEVVVREVIETVQVVLPKETQPIDNFRYRSAWSAEVVDRKAFLAGIVDGTIPDEAWMPNDVLINQQARSLKKVLEKLWPGVRVTERKV